jgi:hypothetical protein
MNKIIGTFIILAVFSLFCPTSGQADLVYIKNGDKLIGTIQSPSFSVQTPYGKVSIKNELLKSIDYNDAPTGGRLKPSTMIDSAVSCLMKASNL